MSVTTKPPANHAGRNSSWLAGLLRRKIGTGGMPVGEYLPTVRELSGEHGVSRETARRAIKLLEAEGLVAAEARHGVRVLARVNDPDRGLPVAFVASRPEGPGLWDDFHRMLLAGLQKAAAERGWSLLAVAGVGRSGREVTEQLRDCRVCGIVLDTISPEVVAAVRRLGMPAVMMDAWDPEMSLDAAVQDGFQGALLAAQHLAGRGHRRIGWLGPIAESAQSRERFGGAAAGIAAAGLELVPEFLADTPRAGAPAAARRMLSRPDRPTAVLGLWHEAAAALVRAATELGLRPGSDLDVVGWTPEEQYDTVYRALFDGGAPPATMVWSVAELARAAVARLAERRAKPALAPALIKIPVRLRLAGE